MSLEKSIRELIEGRENVQAVPRPDNKDRKEIQNVGRTDSAHPTSDKSTLTRTSEIKKKVIDEKEQPMSHLKTSSAQDLYSKVLSILEGKHEKKAEKPEGKEKEENGEKVKLSGGKTEVETEPKTKSQAEIDKETEKEDEKAEKKAEKGDKKKKEVKEALHPNQKKLDVAPPKGKLTSADFKKLRKEEVEELDELSKKTLGSYVKHAAGGAAYHRGSMERMELIGNKKSYDTAKRKTINRIKGIEKAADKLAKEEVEMDEARGVAAGAVDKHNCATHVYHEQFGEGKPIYSQHAEPDAEGNIAWYDVMFEHGIERQVSIDEMKIVASESHGNHKKMKKEEIELDEGSTMRLVKTHTEGPHSAKVYKDHEWGEHRVKFYKNGVHQSKADYHTDDLKDAHSTAQAHLKKMASMKEEVEELDELSSATRASYRAKAGPQAKSFRGQLKVASQVKTNDPDVKSAVDSAKKDIKRKLYNRQDGILRSTRTEETEVAEDAVASAQKSADQKMKAATITAKATVQADKIKDQARKQAKMNNSFEPENVDPIIEAAKKALERISKNPAAPFNDAVKGVKGTDTRADSSD